MFWPYVKKHKIFSNANNFENIAFNRQAVIA